MGIFKPATKKKSRLRMAFCAPAKAGKTFTSLRFAMAFAQKRGSRVAVINTESGAIEKYLGLSPDGIPWDFDIVTLEDFAPQKYYETILAAAVENYRVLVIDSLSHAWAGVGGALEMQSKQSMKKGENSFTAWRTITPEHNRLVETIVRSPCDIFATMRTKMDYVMEEEIDSNGRKKMVPKKVGLAPIQRAGIEYEFDIIADIDADHVMQISGTRCPAIDGAVVMKPTAAFIEPIWQWLNEGIDVDPSYFIASENELIEYERRQKLAAKAEEQAAKALTPVKTASQILAEQAAEREAALKSLDDKVQAKREELKQVGPDAEPAHLPSVSLITAIESSLSLLGDLAGIDVATTRDAILKKRGVNSFRSLSDDQLKEIATALAAKVKEAQAATADREPPFDANGATSQADETAPSATNNSPCGQIQIDEMGKLLDDIAKHDPDIIVKFKAAMASVGATKRSDLTIRQANEMLNALRRKNLELFIDATLRHGWAVVVGGDAKEPELAAAGASNFP